MPASTVRSQHAEQLTRDLQLLRHQSSTLRRELLAADIRADCYQQQIHTLTGIMRGVGRAVLPELGVPVNAEDAGVTHVSIGTATVSDLASAVVRAALEQDSHALSGELVDAAVRELTDCTSGTVEFCLEEARSVLRSFAHPELCIPLARVSPFRMIAQRAALAAALHAVRLAHSQLQGFHDELEAQDAELVRLTEVCAEMMTGPMQSLDDAEGPEQGAEEPAASTREVWDSIFSGSGVDISPMTSP